ncbi:DUF3068 domain-containing protein [Gordonia soli]|uniref:DUF3068 domain-containing protein n=1 Tax=Gordonia soli NBRC 108243 TaxID=1223545 RepID=M0QFI7_9ACTN|nr:DUF3068 domain-containing protein [Gordonia soli]GAC67224.1 hypothetical protein GS4_06_00700 [Gordonia soli NBRC 108243]
MPSTEPPTPDADDDATRGTDEVDTTDPATGATESEMSGRSDTDGPVQSRFTTRELVGPTLLFVGGFLLAVAIALPTLFVDQLKTVGLGIDQTTVGESERGAEILDRCSLDAPTARVVGADLTRQQRVVAVRPADADRVTLQAGTSIRLDHFVVDGREQDVDAPRPGAPEPVERESDPADDGSTTDRRSDREDCTDATVTAVKDRVTIDRRTARPIPGPTGSEVQYDSRRAPIVVADRAGFTYLFPIETGYAPAGLTYFDPTTRRALPLERTGTTTVAGRDAVELVAHVPDTDLNTLGENAVGHPPTTLTRPASWFGAEGDARRPLTAHLHHRAEVRLAVDTTTGTVLDRREQITQEYRFTDPDLGDRATTALSATFGYDEATRRALAADADSTAAPLFWWGSVVPVIAVVLGVAAIVAGLFVTIPAWRSTWSRGRRGRARASEGSTPSS